MKKDDCHFCYPDKRLVLIETEFSYVIASLNPAVPGHLLAIPKTHVKSFTDLEDNELADLAIAAKKAAITIKKGIYPQGMNVVINEGAVAGQTEEHVHYNILPRNKNDNLINLERKNKDRLPICEDDLSLLKKIFKV